MSIDLTRDITTPDFEERGSISASQVSQQNIYGLGDLMFATELWRAEGGATGRFAVPGTLSVNRDIIYQVLQGDVGVLDVPGAGKRRSIRYVGKDGYDAETVVVHLPGFAHTSRYEDPHQHIQLLADLADQYNAAFFTINQTGNAVEGADLAQGRGRISLKQRRVDNRKVLLAVLRKLRRFGRKQIKLVLSGHSLGAREAFNLAYDVISDPNYPVQLSGLVQWAPTGIGTHEDLWTSRYIMATAPHIVPSAKSVLSGAQGLDFSLNAISHLFYSGYGGVELAKIAATGLNMGAAEQFFDITLRSGNADQARKVAEHLAERNHCIAVIRSRADNIFQRPDSDLLASLPNVQQAFLDDMPHNALLPGARMSTIAECWHGILRIV
ncbi:MAG: hypothetical protein HY817_04070 [Candidatus Abawacabacteria bacterium]|nr:hypothetical protein [Candidatus Abawacabacteria bacterium]